MWKSVMAEMTCRERMTAALSGKPVDRVPFLPCIYIDHACFATGHDFREALADPRLGVRLMLDANRLYGSDVVRVLPTPPRRWFEEKEVRADGDDLVQIDRRTGAIEGHYDVQGGGKLIPAEPPEPVRTLDQADAIAFPDADELIETGCFDAAREVTEAAHEEGMFVIGMAGGQTINFLVERIGSAAEALMVMADQPELAARIFEIGTDASIEVGKAFARIGVDCLYIGDSYASGSVISPAMYERFCVPRYRQAADAAHANGIFVYKHCCGNYTPLLHILKDEPLDAMEGIDPTSGMSVAATKRALEGRMGMIGGVSCLSLLTGTPASVYAEARACIEAGGSDGRYILGSACAVPRFSPVENMLAMARAATGRET